MTLSGTIQLNSEVKDRYQFIYASMYNNNFITVYSQFITESNKLKKFSLLLINHTKKTQSYITKASLFNTPIIKQIRDINAYSNTTVAINCLTLTMCLDETQKTKKTIEVEIPVNLNQEGIRNNINNTYLEVLRCDDENILEENFDSKKLVDCVFNDEIKNTTESESFIGPAKICPRGYSKILF